MTLLAPIGISIAQGMGADPHAVLMAIGVAASCAFGTPVGTPPKYISTWPWSIQIYRLCKSRRSIDFSLLRSKLNYHSNGMAILPW